jgi:hypothetical protein
MALATERSNTWGFDEEHTLRVVVGRWSMSLIVNSIAVGLGADPSLPPDPLLDERRRPSRRRPHEHNCSGPAA